MYSRCDQGEPIPNGLQILRLNVHVPPRHLQRGMADHVATLPNVVDREAMPQGVEADPNA